MPEYLGCWTEWPDTTEDQGVIQHCCVLDNDGHEEHICDCGVTIVFVEAERKLPF